MDVAALPHAKLMTAIELIGSGVAPTLRAAAKNHIAPFEPLTKR